MEMAESSLKGYKTLWEKEKLLVTSNFSFSCSVFKILVRQTRKNQGLFVKGLIIRYNELMNTTDTELFADSIDLDLMAENTCAVPSCLEILKQTRTWETLRIAQADMGRCIPRMR